MKLQSSWAVAAALMLPLLGACGKAPAGQKSLSSLKGDDDAKRSVFNLAEYLTTNPYTTDLVPYVKGGDVVFGDMQKIGIRTNAKVETTGKSDLTPNGARNIAAQYYLNGAIYPDIIKIKEQSIIDINAQAGFDVKGIEGYVRILGDDKYSFNQKAEVDQNFVRDLSLTYPIIIGLNAKASIGGEVGFHAEVVIREDDALSLRFQPKVGVNSSLSAEANALRLISAEIKGVMKFFETTVATSATVGHLPELAFSYGDISMDTAEIKALDGKVVVVAKAGLDSLLPTNFQAIWKKISDATGIRLGFTWQHTVWDPAPLWVAKIPARGVFFTSDFAGYNSEECKSIRSSLYAAADIMEAQKNNSKGVDADIAQTAQANILRAADTVTKGCGR